MPELPPEPTRWEDMPGRDHTHKKFTFSLMRRKVEPWASIYAASQRARKAYDRSRPSTSSSKN